MGQVNIRIDEAMVLELERAAKEEGLTVSELVRTAAEMRLSFSGWFWARLKQLSADLCWPPGIVLEKIGIKWIVDLAAAEEVFGPGQSPRLEFSATEKGPIVGQELFEMLKSARVQELEREKEIKLTQSPEVALSPEDRASLKSRQPSSFEESIAGLPPHKQAYLRSIREMRKGKKLPKMKRLKRINTD